MAYACFHVAAHAGIYVMCECIIRTSVPVYVYVCIFHFAIAGVIINTLKLM